MAAEDALRSQLQDAAAQRFGEERAAELSHKLGDVARWLRLIERQPLDLLDEEPDRDGP